jgi:uncharacterized protein (TIGR04255 family)
MSTTALEHLQDAPIDEVACGVVFEPIAALDPIVVGSYWRERIADYPGHELRTPIRDNATVALMEAIGALPPVRVMLTSKDDEFVIQVQPDRFFLNWRRRQGGYPRFNNRDGHEGVLGRAMREFDAFSKFCASATGTFPSAKAIELAKIDVMREGRFWTDLKQVGEILPCLQAFIDFTESGKPSFLLRFSEPRESGPVQVNVALGESKSSRVLTLETRVWRELATPTLMESTFQAANHDLNQVFAALIPAEPRARYFNKGGKQ